MGPQTPQCEALTDLLMAPQIPTHGAPRALVLGLQKLGFQVPLAWAWLPAAPFHRGSWGSHLTQLLSSSKWKLHLLAAPAPGGGSLFVDVPGESPDGATWVRRLLSRVDRYQEGPGEGVAPREPGPFAS